MVSVLLNVLMLGLSSLRLDLLLLLYRTRLYDGAVALLVRIRDVDQQRDVTVIHRGHRQEA